MKFQGVCIAVKDVKLSTKFYQDLFGLEVYQDYGINVSFGGLSLQQDFDWLLGVPKDKIKSEPHNMELYFEEDDFDKFIIKLNTRDDIRYLDSKVKVANWGQRSIKFYDPDGHIIEVGENLKMVVKRFLNSGMTMEETSKRMDVSIRDLEALLNG
ncbi:MAG TPA: glyoxalase [Candidatus Dorea intestinavium]|nr:glyoxalase [Candidatus Dorea intestinavium]